MIYIERKETPQERYDRTHTTRVVLKLNLKTEADIVAALEGKTRQTEAKRLIRLGIAHESQNSPTIQKEEQKNETQ